MRFGIREILYLVVLAAVAGGTWFYGITPVQANVAEYREQTAAKGGHARRAGPGQGPLPRLRRGDQAPRSGDEHLRREAA